MLGLSGESMYNVFSFCQKIAMCVARKALISVAVGISALRRVVPVFFQAVPSWPGYSPPPASRPPATTLGKRSRALPPLRNVSEGLSLHFFWIQLTLVH